MTSQRPERPEPFDAFETRLATRVTRHADRGVRPIDAGHIAHEAAATGRGSGVARRAGAGAGFLGRLGWLVAGAALAAGLIGGASWAGSHGLLGAAPTPSPTLVAVVPTEAPSVEPSTAPTTAPVTAPPTVAPILACALADLAARVTAWDGAAGNRIGTVVLTNTGAVACKLQAIERPQLVDGAGTVLIDGDDPSHPGSVEIAAGARVTTEVDDANYCGPAAVAPVSVAFVFSNGDRLVAAAKSPTDMSGLPDCLGPGGPGLVQMHPWAP
ncbi:MAG: DUF4232 domain-containing protein [Chloroflexi bacterium]|nr:DUF4232 domain-containing protein [Chloroflexota bacterium]